MSKYEQIGVGLRILGSFDFDDLVTIEGDCIYAGKSLIQDAICERLTANGWAYSEERKQWCYKCQTTTTAA